MKNFIIILIILLYSNLLYAKEYSVIASDNMPVITPGELRALYLKKIAFIKNIKAVPLNLPAKSTIRKSFETNILHMDGNRLKHYWIKAHYLGERPPVMLQSQQAVKRFVKRVHGAIGYIQSSREEDGMKVLYRWKDEK